MNESSPLISGKLKWAAFGAILAMFPILILFSLIALEVVKYYHEIDTFLILAIVLQFIGCIIWAASLLSCSTPGKSLKIPSSGWTLCAIGIFIGAVCQFLLLIIPVMDMGIYSYHDGFITLILLIISIIFHTLLAIGTGILGKRIKILKLAKVSYIILAVLPVFYVLFATIIDKSSSWYNHDDHFAILTLACLIIFLISIILLTIAWCCAPSSARRIEHDSNYGEGDFAPQATFYEEPQYTPVQQQFSSVPPVPPTPPTTPAAETYQTYQQPQPAASITEAQRNLLMGMSDQELNNVINNPTLYTNKAFVEEAKKIATKRQAWEAIKDYSDEQLLSVIHENIQGFAYEVLDAASLELYTRESPAFVNEINGLTTEELQGIVENSGAYFDGYVQAAKAVLSQRLNNPASSQV